LDEESEQHLHSPKRGLWNPSSSPELEFHISGEVGNNLVAMETDIITSTGGVIAKISQQPVTFLMALTTKQSWDALPRRVKRDRVSRSNEVEMSE
jgi:hypothetical protein